MERKKIGQLTPGVHRRATYRRDNGKTYCLLKEWWHVEVAINPAGQRIGQGKAEPADPDEEVEVINDGVVNAGRLRR
jgi:hypothetical protein